MRKKIIFTTFILQFALNGLLAQSSINCGGGDGSNAGSSISYTVGQIDFSPIANSFATFTPGIQQPYLTITSSTYETANKILCVFPNPANNYIQINSVNNIQSEYTLYAIDGSTVLKGYLKQQTTIVDISQMHTGLYYLKTNNKTIKIIKI